VDVRPSPRLSAILRVEYPDARSRKTSLILRIGNLSISLSCFLNGPQNRQGQIASQVYLKGWPHAVEPVATSSWNPWPHVHGFDGHMLVEYSLLCPCAASDGGDAVGLVDQLIPSITAMIEDFIIPHYSSKSSEMAGTLCAVV